MSVLTSINNIVIFVSSLYYMSFVYCVYIINTILCYPCYPLYCLFLVWLGLLSHWRIFHSYGDVTITGEGLQNLTHARHTWPLSSEGSLSCHTYCDTGHGHLRGPVTLTPIAKRLAVELSLPVLRLRSVAAGIWTPNLPLAGQSYNPLGHSRGFHCFVSDILILYF